MSDKEPLDGEEIVSSTEWALECLMDIEDQLDLNDLDGVPITCNAGKFYDMLLVFLIIVEDNYGVDVKTLAEIIEVSRDLRIVKSDEVH